MSQQQGNWSRRSLLAGAAGGVVGGAVIGYAAHTPAEPNKGSSPAPSAGYPVSPHGPNQAGIVAPANPQRTGLMTVLDLPRHGAAALARAVAAMGSTIAAIVLPEVQTPPEVVADPGDLTVTIGLGAALVPETDRPDLAMPAFAGDDAIAHSRTGGDLLISCYATNASVLGEATDALLRVLTKELGTSPSVRFTQFLARGLGEDGVVRNPLGFLDGIVVPRTPEDLSESVWMSAGAWAGGTITVIRMLHLERSEFLAQSIAEQEQVIGRERATGQPLSGGDPLGPADLLAKTPEGEFLIPLHSHVRAAHPSFTGSGLMLRRGYGFDNGGAGRQREAGLMFTCFQNTIETFNRTQLRLDVEDDLMPFAVPRGSWSFAILPGFSPEQPLGSGILDS